MQKFSNLHHNISPRRLPLHPHHPTPPALSSVFLLSPSITSTPSLTSLPHISNNLIYRPINCWNPRHWWERCVCVCVCVKSASSGSSSSILGGRKVMQGSNPLCVTDSKPPPCRRWRAPHMQRYSVALILDIDINIDGINLCKSHYSSLISPIKSRLVTKERMEMKRGQRLRQRFC